MATANSNLTKYGFEKLTSSNWSTWHVKFRGVCRRKGIDDALTNAESEHSSKVLGELTGCIEDQFLHTVDEAANAAAAWQQLHLLFQQTSTTNYFNIRQQFNSMKLQPNEAILAYISRGKALVQQLAESGDLVDDRGLIVQLLAGLPDEYLMISKMIRRQDPFPGLTEVQGTLLNEEQEIKQRAADKSAAQPPANDRAAAFISNDRSSNQRQDSNGQGTNSNRRCFYCGKRNHTKAECRKRIRDEERRARMRDTGDNRQSGGRGICEYCGKPNHTAEVCRHRIRAEQARNSGPTQRNNVAFTAQVRDCGGPHSMSGNLACASAAAGLGDAPSLMTCNLATTTAYPVSTWVIDSGASKHMTGHVSIFAELRYLPKPIIIDYGDGSQLSAVAEGTVILMPTASDNRSSCIESPVTLRNVLYIPGHQVNLLSTRVIARAGGEVIQSHAGCVITFRGTPIMYSTPRSDEPLLTIDFVEYDTSNNSGTAQRALIASANTATALAAQHKPQVKSALDWHSSYAHLGFQNLAKLPKLVNGINVSAGEFLAAGKHVCDICQKNKQVSLPFESSDNPTTAPLQLVHSDLCGPITPASLGGACYIATFLDDFTGYSIVKLLKRKSDMQEIMPQVISYMERQVNGMYTVKAVRTDNGTEYVNTALLQYFASQGIEPQTSCPYTPQQNGKAERLNRTLLEKGRVLVNGSDLAATIWGEAVMTANLLRNLSPASGKPTTPYEAFFGRRPDVSYLQPYGTKAFALIPKERRTTKFDEVAVEGKLVGYELEGSGYRLLLSDNTICSSRKVVFSSKGLPETPANKQVRFDLAAPAHPSDSDSDDDDIPDLNPDSEDEYDSASDGGDDPPGTEDPDDNPGSDGTTTDSSSSGPAAAGGQTPALADDDAAAGNSAPRRSARSTAGVPSSRYQDFAMTAISNSFGFSDIPEPKTYAEAMASEHAAEWQQAMAEEIASLLQQGTWVYVETPPGIKPIPVEWVFKVKRDGQGRVERFKARVVAKGFKQQEGIDYDEVFAPVSKYTTFRTLMAIAAADDLEIQQLDIKTAFLQGELAERIYIQQPDGFHEGSTSTCCLLNKAIYGLKQAPRVWHHRLHEELELIGFRVSDSDPGLYIYDDKSGPTYLLVYVDDILLVSSSTSMINSIRDRLLSTFDARDLGAAVTYLGINILRDRGSRSITLVQQRMITDIISKFGLSEATIVSVPLSSSIKLSKDEGLPLDTSHFPYSQMVGSLMYLSVCTRPDISFAVGALARYMSCPTTVHSQAAKSVGRYLKGTANYGITFGGTGNSSFRGSSEPSAPAKDSSNLELLGFCDADYAADSDTRRSTTGYVFTFNGGAVTWQSKRQPTVAASTAEAEYMAAAAAVKEGLWLRKLLTDLGQPTAALKIFADNQSAIKLLRNPISSIRSKHIDIAHHFARERVMRGEVAFSYISTADQIADILTKALPAAKLKECRADMGVKAVSVEAIEDEGHNN